MTFPNHIRGSARKSLGGKWGRASAESRERQRAHTLPDGETLYRRALADARGQIVRAGFSVVAGRWLNWCVRRAMLPGSRTNQFEFVASGRVKLTAGPRRFPRRIRPDGRRGLASE